MRLRIELRACEFSHGGLEVISINHTLLITATMSPGLLCVLVNVVGVKGLESDGLEVWQREVWV